MVINKVGASGNQGVGHEFKRFISFIYKEVV
jgi:hypothetical protein